MSRAIHVQERSDRGLVIRFFSPLLVDPWTPVRFSDLPAGTHKSIVPEVLFPSLVGHKICQNISHSPSARRPFFISPYSQLLLPV